jgi:hypothetical protein
MQVGFADSFAAAGYGDQEKQWKQEFHCPQINAD